MSIYMNVVFTKPYKIRGIGYTNKATSRQLQIQQTQLLQWKKCMQGHHFSDIIINITNILQ